MPALESFKWLLIVLELGAICIGLVVLGSLGGCASAPEGKTFEVLPPMEQHASYERTGWQWCSDGSVLQCPLFDIGVGVIELPHGARLGHTDLP